MELNVTFKFLHVVSMFFFVAMAVSGEVVLRRVATSRDVRTIRTVVPRIRVLTGPVSLGFLLAGVVFGILAALTGQIDLLAPWLLLAYAAFVASMAVGMTVTDPWVGRLERAAGASDEGTPSEALLAVIDDPLPRYGTWALMALITVLVFIMVVKPLG